MGLATMCLHAGKSVFSELEHSPGPFQKQSSQESYPYQTEVWENEILLPRLFVDWGFSKKDSFDQLWCHKKNPQLHLMH